MARSAMNRRMLRYIGKRALRHYSTIWLIAAVTFLLIEPQLFNRHLYCTDRGCKNVIPEVVQRIIRLQEQSLAQRFFSYMLLDVEEGEQTAVGWLDLGLFGVYEVGPESGTRLACGAVCLNFGPSYFRQRGKDVEDILFGPRP